MKRSLSSLCTILVLSVVVASGAAATTHDGAPCPLKTGTASGGTVQWAFSESGPPSGKHPGLRSSYTHGHGTWTGGRAAGTVCSQDSITGGSSRNLVLTVSGPSKLSPRITQLGLLGVGLVLPLRVTASDDPACETGTRGTATLFASYYSVHRDTLALHFVHGCADHDHQFAGSDLHVLISHDGAQVNSATARP